MNRARALRKAKLIKRLVDDPRTPPEEAETASRRLRLLCESHKLAPEEIADKPPEPHELWGTLPLNDDIPQELAKHLGVVLTAAGGGFAVQSSGAVVAGPLHRIGELLGLANRLVRLYLDNQAKEPSRLILRSFWEAQMFRTDTESIWCGITAALVRRLLASRMSAQEARVAEAQRRAAEEGAACTALVLCQDEEERPSGKQRAAFKATDPFDYSRGQSIGAQFDLLQRQLRKCA